MFVSFRVIYEFQISSYKSLDLHSINGAFSRQFSNCAIPYTSAAFHFFPNIKKAERVEGVFHS